MSEIMENAVARSDTPSASEEVHAPAPWREALLAGLPHALMALTVQAVAVAAAYSLIPSVSESVSEGGQPIQIAGVGVFALGLIAALVIAQRQGWPRWSASWFGYATLLLIGLLAGALKVLEPTLGSWMANNLGVAYFRLLAPLLLAITLCALALRNRLRFLLALLPLPVVLWTPLLEFSWYPLRTTVVLMAWLCAGGVAVLIARSGRVRTGVWLALAFNLLVGLAYTYTRTYHADFPPGAPAHYSLPPTLLDWLNRFAPGALATSVVILEPLLVWSLRKLGQRSGPLGMLGRSPVGASMPRGGPRHRVDATTGFRLSLVGLILLLAADLTASWWLGSGWTFITRAWGYEVASGLPLSVLAYVAMLLCLSGAISFGVALARTGTSIEEGASLFLAFALVAMPLILALPIAYKIWDIRTISRIWLYVVGLPWLALGLWLVTRRNIGRVSGVAA